MIRMDDGEDVKNYLIGEKYDADSTCRSCLVHGDTVRSVFNMFNIEDVDWVERLQECANVDVCFDDGLPRGLCPECKEDLIRAHNLRTRCRRSEDLLKSLKRDNVKSEPDSPTENDSDDEPLQNLCVKSETDETTSEARCEICRRTFPTERGLALHMLKTHNRKSNGMFECGECMYTTYQQSEMNDHIAEHTKDKPFACKVCGKNFKNASSLREHKKRHENSSCSFCGKYFRSTAQLEKHQSTPNVHTIFQCDNCSYKTYQKSSIQSHVLTHSTAKPFKCDACGKSFKSSSSLQKHKLHICVNASRRCGICSRNFSSEAHLKAHQATAGVHVRFQCDNCSFFTYSKKSFAIHQSREEARKNRILKKQQLKCNPTLQI